MEIVEAFRTEEDVAEPAAVVDGLRAVVTAPQEREIEQLEEISSRHRVLLLRTGAVVAVSSLIAVGGALLIHLVLAGVVVLGLWFPGMSVKPTRGAMSGLTDAGGAPGPMMIVGDGGEDSAPADPGLPALPGGMAAGVASILPPQLPEARIAAPAPAPAVPNVASVSTIPEIPAAPPSPANFGAPVSPLPAPAIAAPTVATPTVAAPNAVASGAAGGLAIRNMGGEGAGGGEPDRVNSLFKGGGGSGAGGGGTGAGSGSGNGNGINRGMSLGDRPAQELNQLSIDTTLTLPLKYRMHPPEKDVTLSITIGADGATKSVRVEESCGFADVDELVRAFIEATRRWSPEYRGGKAVESVHKLNYTFHDL